MRLFEQSGLVQVLAVDRSVILRTWMREVERSIPIASRLGALRYVVRRWGIGGLLAVWRSRGLLQNRHLGYVIVTGKKRGTPSFAPA